MKRIVVASLVLGASALPFSSAWAVGTAAGTVISNTAQANFEVGGVAATPVTSSVDVTVDEIVDVTVVSQDAANVPVSSADSGDVLTFVVTNTGKRHRVARADHQRQSRRAAGPVQPARDRHLWSRATAPRGCRSVRAATPCTTGPPRRIRISMPTPRGSESATVYVVSDTPGGLNNGDTGAVELLADATTAGAPGAAAGTSLPGVGDGGVDAVVGTTNADGSDTGVYQVQAVNVSLNKTVLSITDPFGGAEEVPGATVAYQIQVDVTGTGTADNLIITDAIPANTSLAAVPDAIVLDGVNQTLAQDTDASDFNLTNPNTVTVDLGNAPAPSTATIEVRVVIN